jgi:hypothetical protein
MARCGFAVPLVLLLVSVASAQNPSKVILKQSPWHHRLMTALTQGGQPFR